MVKIAIKVFCLILIATACEWHDSGQKEQLEKNQPSDLELLKAKGNKPLDQITDQADKKTVKAILLKAASE